VAGQNYSLEFLLTNPADNAPSGFYVTASNTLTATPEPNPVGPLGLVMCAVLFLAYKRKVRA
jgi:hypothetical protein